MRYTTLRETLHGRHEAKTAESSKLPDGEALIADKHTGIENLSCAARADSLDERENVFRDSVEL